jgi:hypothetical protein
MLYNIMNWKGVLAGVVAEVFFLGQVVPGLVAFQAMSHSGNVVPSSVVPGMVVPGLVVPGSVVPGSVGVPTNVHLVNL